jgi:alanine dehydrogenase
MKIGILKETKIPPDKRVPLTPQQCRKLNENYPHVEVLVQPDSCRAYTDKEYQQAGIKLAQDLSSCDLLLGIKEVGINTLLEDKTYLFFSHTAKKQEHNRDLLRAILSRRIKLIDYEYLTTDNNARVVAFGKWAGIVGAYNGLLTYGKRYHKFTLKPAWQCRDKTELFNELKKVRTGKLKIVITGGGRVAHGAMETLIAAGIRKINPDSFLANEFQEPVFTQLDPWHYVKRIDGQEFELMHFFNFPEEYETTFLPFTHVADMFIACHFWDPRSSAFMTKEDMKSGDFRIKIIADVSCDIEGPIPSTLRASTIVKPVYGYDPVNECESDPWEHGNITVMAVDNLPGELPRDASQDFGQKLLDEVIPYLLGVKKGQIIERATIAEKGNLTYRFNYLEDFVQGLE